MFTKKTAEEISKLNEVEINDYHTALEKHREEKEAELNKSISEKASNEELTALKAEVENLKIQNLKQ